MKNHPLPTCGDSNWLGEWAEGWLEVVDAFLWSWQWWSVFVVCSFHDFVGAFLMAEDIFVEMRHAIQVRAPLVCHDGTSAYEPIFLRECLRCLVLSVWVWAKCFVSHLLIWLSSLTRHGKWLNIAKHMLRFNSSMYFFQRHIFGSYRSSRSHNVCLSVRAAHT